MRSQEDERAQSVQVGAIILFGFIIIALSSYQASVVPQLEKNEDANYIDDTQTKIVEVSNEIENTGSSGATKSLVLDARRPYRAPAFVNSPDAYVRSSTTNYRTIEVKGTPLVPDYNVRDYSLQTRFIKVKYGTRRLQPEYTYVENGFVHTRWRPGNVTEDESGPITGTTIEIALVDGNVTAAPETSFRFTAVSVSRSTRTFEANNSSIVFPTEASEQTWSQVLQDADISGYDYRGNRIEVFLRDNTTYDLKISKIVLGEAERLSGTQITQETPNGTSPVVVTVRDRYGNPVPNADVTTNGSSREYDTGADGEVPIPRNGSFTVSLASNSSVNLTVRGEESRVNSTSQQLPNQNGSTAGTGGESDFYTDSNIELSTAGGIWKNITNAENFSLREPRLTPLEESSKNQDEKQRWVKVTLTIEENVEDDQNVQYLVQIGKQDGVRYEPSGGKIQNDQIWIYKQNADGSTSKTIDNKKLNTTAVRLWIKGESELEIFNPSTYDGLKRDERLLLEEVRDALADDQPDEAFITSVRGRTRLSANRTA